LRLVIGIMRYISLIIALLAPFFMLSAPAADTQVRVNGRVASFESVIVYCKGDTAAAEQISALLPVATPYYNRARTRVEKLYNTLNPAWLCVGAAIFCTLLPSSTALSVLLLIFLAGEFAVRWWLGDYLPLTALTDFASAIALILGCFAIIKAKYRRLLCPLIAILMVCAATWGSHPAVRAANPALISGWLPFHVVLMACAYSLFLISAVSAAVNRVGKRTFICVVAGEICLIVGVLIGSLWAAEAWGSYWSWDPKETAALVTLLIYLAVINCWGRLQHRATLLRVALISAFVAVLFTWLGVSGGLHSY
ncbi:MAG: cytochrome c biogenesis protein CcsA, partial [Paramuribaculum sp.]|nr:cytochrome c biogenesis protein CcsA [Paramuribaculum sp.]